MRLTDRQRLGEQYADDARLALRIETHRRFSERPDNTPEWVVDLLAPEAGALVLDAGAGNGGYHPTLEHRGVRVLAYYASGPVDSVREPTDETRRELPARVDELVRQRIAADGEFRIPKRVVCYLATST